MSAPLPPSALRELRLLVRMELMRLWRTSEVLRFIVLPALVGLPVLVFAVVMATSMRGPRATIAAPADLPAALALPETFEGDDVVVKIVADPRAAWEAGLVDGAIVDVLPAPGVAASTEAADQPAWIARILANDGATASVLASSTRHAGYEWLADIVALAGGDAERDLWVASIRTLPDDEDMLPFSISRGLAAYSSFMLGFVAYLFLALPLVADRAEGVTETLRALPISPARTMLARLLAMGLLQLLVALLVVVNVALLFAPLARGEDFPVPTLAQLAAVVTSTVFVSAGYALVGVLAPTIKTASNGATLVMFSHLGLMAWALLGQPPAFVPIAGAIAASTPLGQAIGVAASLAAALGLVALMGHLLSSRVDLVLPRGNG